MTLVLKQVRECDGACCRESPRFPNADHSDCIYHDRTGKENNGCRLMRGDDPIPTKGGVLCKDLTTKQLFEETCVKWPHNMPDRDTGDCCWQLVKNG